MDPKRIRLYLETLCRELETISEALRLSNEEIANSPLTLRGVKYGVILIADAIAGIAQHILAKQYKITVTGFGELLAKAASKGILDDGLYSRLAPFLRFRNMLVHGYWKVDDALFIENLRNGVQDFENFVQDIRSKFLSEDLPVKADEEK